MAQNVSGFGGAISLVASVTFPTGVLISQFSNDADPLDMAPVKIADTAMGVNGDQIVWSKAMPLPLVISVIPQSNDDINLQLLADNNRVAQGKVSTNDEITATVLYPNGATVTLSGGRLTEAAFGNSISSEGRMKTKVYTFSFQTKSSSSPF